MTADESRVAELRANLGAVRARIAAACATAGRSAAEVTLIAVTKTFPASDVRLLVELGVLDIGENRDQEAARKVRETAGLDPRPRWHFVGQLQVNKARSVVRYADVVHSVDRPRLVEALGARARAAGRVVTSLVQVDLDPGLRGVPGGRPAGPASLGHPEGDPSGYLLRGVPGGRPPGPASPRVPEGYPSGYPRGGVPPDEAPALADAVAAEEGLVLGGVMAVAPLGAAPRPAFRKLAEVAGAIRAAHPGATMISAGMTGDLEQAIAEGATHVRVGTALLGGRSASVR